LRHGLSRVLTTLARLVRDSPPPYSIRPPGTPGRPPTDPRDVARFLLLRALEGRSYDAVHASLLALPTLARGLGFRKIPAAPTVAALVPRVPADYFERLLGRLALGLAHGPESLAADGTGLSTRRYERWIAPAKSSDRHRSFIKLHALVATRSRFPFFCAAHVTDARTNDVTELPRLLGQLPSGLAIGNVALDAGYLSRANAQAVADRGGRPVMALRRNVGRIDAGGRPAWSAMLRERRRDGRAFRRRYRRRAVIEGVFGAFKERFGATVRSRGEAAQRVELLGRTVVWNAVASAYHRG
jgi:hypothetical protein